MPDFAEPLARVIAEFRRLPGIGQKSAQRVAFHLLRTAAKMPSSWHRPSSTSKTSSRSAKSATTSADADLPVLPRSAARQKVICAVEDPNNIVGIEVTRQFNGLYHVLGGALSPLRGIGPEQLKIKSLIDRIARGGVEEVIAATNPTSKAKPRPSTCRSF